MPHRGRTPVFPVSYFATKYFRRPSYAPECRFPGPYQMHNRLRDFSYLYVRRANMKRISAPLAVVCCVLALLFVGHAQAQQVSSADKDKALQLLESSKKDVVDATKGLSEAQWNFKTAPDRWSIAECILRVCLPEELTPQKMTGASHLCLAPWMLLPWMVFGPVIGYAHQRTGARLKPAPLRRQWRLPTKIEKYSRARCPVS